jgi:hypothetical protein
VLDLSTVAIPLLSGLRQLPVWLLGGLALAGYAVIFAPSFGGIDPAEFRSQWGVWARIWALTFSALTIARGLDIGVKTYSEHRKALEARRVLRLVRRDHPWPLRRGWWHLAKQQDGSLVSQISLDLEMTNLSDYPVQITKVRLVRPKPKGEPLTADLSLPVAGSSYYSCEHPILPRSTVEAHLHMLVPGAVTRQGKRIRATFGFTDQFDCEYRLRRVLIPADDPKLPHSMKEVTLDELLRLARK